MASSFSVTVKGNVKAMTRDLNQVQRKIIPRTTARALNTAAARTRTQSVREISRVKGIKQKLVRARLSLRKAHPGKLIALLTAKVHGVRAIDLGNPRQTRRGTRVGKHQFPSAFVARMPSGHEGVFKRLLRDRLPIIEQRVPLEPEATRIIERHVQITGGKEFVREFERLVKVALARPA